MKAIYAHGAKDLRLTECAVDPLESGDVRVRLARGGICGSDLHYFNHGGFGTVRLKEPMILGHEVSGYVAEVGADVTGGMGAPEIVPFGDEARARDFAAQKGGRVLTLDGIAPELVLAPVDMSGTTETGS